MARLLSLQTGYFPDDMAAEYQDRKQVTAQNRPEFRLDFVNTFSTSYEPHAIVRGSAAWAQPIKNLADIPAELSENMRETRTASVTMQHTTHV